MSAPHLTRSLAGLLAAATLLSAAPPATAHSLLLSCKKLGAEQVRCQAEFSDGSDAAGMTLQVRSYDDRVLLNTTLGTDSAVSFKRPAGEFYVRLSDGGEHAVEVDHADIP